MIIHLGNAADFTKIIKENRYVLVDFFATGKVQPHVLIKVWHTETVNAADGCNDDYITAFHKGVCCCKAKLIDFAVYGSIFFYI